VDDAGASELFGQAGAFGGHSLLKFRVVGTGLGFGFKTPKSLDISAIRVRTELGHASFARTRPLPAHA
jgi:hypothetical protein